MLRILLMIIMAGHGLIHFIGFRQEWNLGNNTMLRGKTLIDLSEVAGKISGVLWLVTGLLFLTAVTLGILRKEYYWIPAAVALLISQTLIIVYWPDAKFGTLVNLIIAISVGLSAAASQHNAGVQREIDTLSPASEGEKILVTEARISHLPDNVRRWLRIANVVGHETGNRVRITQRGSMKTKPDGQWMPFTATQVVTVNPPGFVWKATIHAGPLLEIAARDKYAAGKGNMLIRPLHIYTLANSSGPEIDQGTLLRFLAEIMWYPQAAVSDYLRWEKTDDRHARVTMTFGGTEATGTFLFAANGDVQGFEAQRYGDFGGTFKRECWSIRATEHQTFNGTRIPIVCEVTWKLKSGDFTWLKLELTGAD